MEDPTSNERGPANKGESTVRQGTGVSAQRRLSESAQPGPIFALDCERLDTSTPCPAPSIPRCCMLKSSESRFPIPHDGYRHTIPASKPDEWRQLFHMNGGIQ